MKLLFTGAISGWLLAALFVGISAYTIWVYRQPQLPRPWQWILPSLRITAVGLLILMLLQPVLGRVHETTVRGHIPVIVDTSGSMSITDRYPPAEQVAIAWNFNLFPRKLRNTEFEAQLAEVDKITQHLQPVVNPGAAAPTGRGLKGVPGMLSDIESAVNKAIEEIPYIATQKGLPGHGLLAERFDNIVGDSLDSLTGAAAFPGSPTSTTFIKAFEVPVDSADNFGYRVRGYIIAPATGTYHFMATVDDQMKLYLSTDTGIDGKREIISLGHFTEYGRYDMVPEQRSQAVQLEVGKPYYIELLHKEGYGRDYASVAWERPDGRREGPIPADYLIPFGARPDSPALDDVRQQFSKLLKTTTQAVAAAQAEADKSPVDNDAVQRLLADTRDQWPTARVLLKQLQAAADRALAESGNPEVDRALATVSSLSRRDWALRLLTGEEATLLPRLQQKGEVDLYSMREPVTAVTADGLKADPFGLAATRTGSVVHQIIANYAEQPVSGVILLSDGNANSGKPIAELRKTLQERGIPLYAISIGSEIPPRDIVIEQVLAPETVFKNDTVAVSVVVRRPGYEGQSVHLTLSRDDKVLAEADIPPGSTANSTAMSFHETEVGNLQYQVTATPMGDEMLTSNNTKPFAVQVLEDPVRILFIDEFPRWESRYATLILQRDPRVKLDSVFVDVLATRPDAKGLRVLPSDRDALFAYDLIVLGDVAPFHFSVTDLQNLRDFVQVRGGAMVIVAGASYMPAQYRPTPLNDILPFRDSSTPGRAEINTRGTVEIALKLRETFSMDPLLQLGSTPEDSRMLWQELPGMSWVNSDASASTSADELVHTEPQNWPVMLTANPGAGSILYLGSDSFWRWRYRIGWAYHQRLWSQVLLWAVRGRAGGSDPLVKLVSDRPAYAPDEPVLVKARVFQSDGRVLIGGSVSVEVRDESGKMVCTVPLTAIDGVSGEYRASVRGLGRGHYVATPRVVELEGKPIQASWQFEVRDLPTSEYVHLSLSQTGLEEIADEVFSLSQAGAAADAITPVTITERHRTDIEIWDTFWMLALVTLLLGAEWQLRKRNKLV